MNYLYRAATDDYRFGVRHLVAIFGDGRSYGRRAELRDKALACGAKPLGKARVNKEGGGQVQLDQAFGVKDWEAFMAAMGGEVPPPEPGPLERIEAAIARIEEAIARIDERYIRSPDLWSVLRRP